MKTSLEGLRGAAAVCVVVFHVLLPVGGQFTNGYLAVDLFFVLSGFVMNSAYGAALTNGGALRVFLVRRIGRLWPVYAVTTVAVYFLSNLHALTHAGYAYNLPTLREVVALVTLTQSLHTFPDFVGNITAWSISVEFYTYLVFAAVCLMLRGRARIAAFAALSVIGYAVTVYATVGLHDCIKVGECFNVSVDFGLSRCIAGFFAGALVAQLRLHASASAQVTAFAVAAWLMFAAPSVYALAAPLIFAFLIAALANDAGPVARLFQGRTAQYLGRVSYSLYLAHGALGPFLMGALGATNNAYAHVVVASAYVFASFAFAHLLNVYVEGPARRYAYSLSAPRVSAECRA